MPRTKTPLESVVQKSCLNTLAMLGITHWRVNTGGIAGSYKGKKRFIRYGTPGHSDIFAMMKLSSRDVDWGTCPVFIECKRIGAKQSEDQKSFEKMVKQAGAIYWVVTSASELIEKLRGVGYPV